MYTCTLSAPLTQEAAASSTCSCPSVGLLCLSRSRRLASLTDRRTGSRGHRSARSPGAATHGGRRHLLSTLSSSCPRAHPVPLPLREVRSGGRLPRACGWRRRHHRTDETWRHNRTENRGEKGQRPQAANNIVRVVSIAGRGSHLHPLSSTVVSTVLGRQA